STTARTTPARSTCWVHCTGAALTRFAVKTPAAVASGPSLTTSATSGPSPVRSPAATPAARNPFGAVTVILPRPPRRTGQEPFASCGGSLALASSRSGHLRCSFLAPRARSTCHPQGGEAGRLVQAEHEVGALDGLAGGALAEVVQRGEHDDAA